MPENEFLNAEGVNVYNHSPEALAGHVKVARNVESPELEIYERAYQQKIHDLGPEGKGVDEALKIAEPRSR